jgi:hypothetical protein
MAFTTARAWTTGRFVPFVPFDPALDGWACWDHIGATGWPECYDYDDPNSCEYDPWGSQLDYDDLAQVRDTVYAWYPECSYNTHVARLMSVRVVGSGSIDLEVRLMKYPTRESAGELVDSRTDVWEIP